MGSWKAKEISTVANFIGVIESWEKKFFDPGIGFPPIWYRGQSNSDWGLYPGILRPDFVKMAQSGELQITDDPDQQIMIREATLNKQYLRMGASLFPPGASLAEKYFLAQHHGFPTRLLDWTTNALAALFFAISGSPDKDGAVFVLNPRYLIPDRDDPQDTNYPLDFVEADYPMLAGQIGYICGRYDTGGLHPKPFILPITPGLWAGRMLQQGSCFTFHMPKATAMDSYLGASKLEKYIIPQAAKAEFRTLLRRMNVTEATLFCDLDHLSKEIKSAYGLD